MKAIYWRPQKASPKVLLIIGVLSVAGLTGLHWAAPYQRSNRSMEIAAARRAEDCMRAVKEQRLQLGHKIDVRFDPHQTGMIGQPISAATSKAANLGAKQISTNPNFAAAVVRMLRQAGVQHGDSVAVGWTGSFPGLNVALCAAIETMGLHPIAVGSALSSQYGANDDEFLWLDMESHLADVDLISFRSAAMTIGGAADRAMGESSETIEAASGAHRRTGVAWLEASNLKQSIDARMKLYGQLSKNKPVVAYINVGGGIASMGGSRNVDHLQPGLNQRVRNRDSMPDCVARRFAKMGTPVIHLGEARKLAQQYSLNTDLSQLPVAGEGALFQQRPPSRLMASGLLLAISVLLHGFISRDYGYRAIDLMLVVLRFRARPLTYRGVGETVVSQLMA